MVEDKRAHERINSLEEVVKVHLQDHVRFEAKLQKNTDLTQTIADNTSELVILVKGAKGTRKFVIWVAPVVAAIIATWEWLKTQFHF